MPSCLLPLPISHTSNLTDSILLTQLLLPALLRHLSRAFGICCQTAILMELWSTPQHSSLILRVVGYKRIGHASHRRAIAPPPQRCCVAPSTEVIVWHCLSHVSCNVVCWSLSSRAEVLLAPKWHCQREHRNDGAGAQRSDCAFLLMIGGVTILETVVKSLEAASNKRAEFCEVLTLKQRIRCPPLQSSLRECM